MKTVWVLVLVLLCVGSANAAYQLQSDMMTMQPSDVATISVYGEAGEEGAGIFYLIVEEGEPGTLFNPQLTPAAGNLGGAYTYIEAGWNSSGYELTVADNTGFYPGGLWATFDLHCDGPGVINVQLYKDSAGYEQPVASLPINMQPYPDPFIALSKNAIDLTVFQDGPNPDDEILSITNWGEPDLHWQLVEDCNWLSADVVSGIAETYESNDVTLSFDITGLDAGDYSCDVIITDPNASNDPQLIDVELTVVGPVISLSSSAFNKTAYEDGANPADDVLTIQNTGGGTLNWQITETCGWLSIDAVSGGLQHDESEPVTISYDITGLSAGVYSYDLAVTDPDAENNPQTVQIDLTVIGPTISVNPDAFSMTMAPGDPNPADDSFTIQNVGGGTLNWQITETCSWLSIDIAAGSLTRNATDQVTISYDVSGLPEGYYSYYLIITDPATSQEWDRVRAVMDIHAPYCGGGETAAFIAQYDDVAASGATPDCWCYPRQCHGDVDGLPCGKSSYYASVCDLYVLLSAWNEDIATLVAGDPADICADFDHQAEGKLLYRVSTIDLSILIANWNISNGPAPDCVYDVGIQ